MGRCPFLVIDCSYRGDINILMELIRASNEVIMIYNTNPLLQELVFVGKSQPRSRAPSSASPEFVITNSISQCNESDHNIFGLIDPLSEEKVARVVNILKHFSILERGESRSKLSSL